MPRSAEVDVAVPSWAAVTPQNIAAARIARAGMSVTGVAGSDSATPPAPHASATSATRRHPERSAAPPATGPSTPKPHMRKISPPAAWLQSKGGRSRRNVTNEKTPTKAKNNALAAAVACWSPGVGAPPHAPAGPGEQRQGADRPAPPDHSRRQRDPDPPDDAAADERADVDPHRPAAEARAEHLDDVRRADGPQA